MAEEDEGPPEKAAPGGAPMWIVTFSDLMSLLLAFFVLLFAFSSMDDKKFKQMGGSLSHAFGVQRFDPNSTDPIMGVNHIAQEFSSSRPDNTILNIIPQQQLLLAVRYLTAEPPVRLDNLSSQGSSDEQSDKMKSPNLEDAPQVDVKKTTTIQMSSQEEQKALSDAESLAVTIAENQTEAGQDVNDGQSMQDQMSSKELAEEQDIAGGAKSDEDTAGGPQNANQSKDGRESAMNQSAAARSISEDEPEQENVFKHKGDAADPTYEKLHSGARELRQKLAKEIEQGLIDVETDGNNLIIRVADETSFEPGSAELSEPAGPIMTPIADVLQQLKGDIIVSGHTDNTPVSNSEFRSNWDLSAGRAATVVREIMKIRPILPDRFKVEAYADTKPLVMNDTEWGRSRNRRVEIVVHQAVPVSKKKVDPLDRKEEIIESDNKKSGNSSNRDADKLDQMFESFPDVFEDEQIGSVIF